MGFKFCWLVELLEGLDAAQWQNPLSYSRVLKPEHLVADKWFKEYGHKVPRHGPAAVAFLSCIFPERLSQRSYAMQEARLAAVMGRILCLGTGRANRLRKWQESNLDFPTCLQHIMAEAEMPLPEAGSEVTLEEIDQALLQIAANSPFSSPEIKRKANGASPHDILLPIVRRLQSREAKWLIRMILKAYNPVRIPEERVMHAFHFLLPDILAVQNTLEAAVAILGQEDIRSLPPNPPKELRPLFRKVCARYVVPKLGVMIRRQPYYKARSIRHCCQMARERPMSVERKYDGEYCQIHIDMSKPIEHRVQIFSKSGKNSTEDRIRLHGAIIAGLRLDEPDCTIRRACIVEGELLVWSRSKKTIQPFHVIRKHVMHGLRFLGTEADSPRKPDEQLMIMFYDILLLDDKVLTNEAHSVRRETLESLVKQIEGEAGLGYRNIIDFTARSAKSELREFFVHAINERWEGLVLKGCGDPYFSWEENSSVIKLKKDYIAGLGDTVDLCIVGGRRAQTVVDELKTGDLSWTAFHLACIENREEVRRFKAKPSFRILDVLSCHNLSKDNILYLNQRGQFLRLSYAEKTAHLDVRIDQKGIQPPTALFKEPFVVEVMGAGFEKPSNAPYFTLRFPRALNVKLHMDRSVIETNTFAELQDMAHKSMTPSLDPEDTEEARWLQRLILADGKAHDVDGNSQSTTTSPSKSTPGNRDNAADSQDNGFGWPDSGAVSSTAPEGTTSNVRASKSTSSQGTPGNCPKRKLDVSILLSPSEAARKRIKVRCNSVPNGISRKALMEDDSGRPSLACAKALVPISYALQSALSKIPPFDPPAIFRATRKPSTGSSSSLHARNKRQPLSELPNISSQNVLKRRATVDSSVKSLKRAQKAGRTTSARQPPEKMKAGDARKHRIIPGKGLATDRLIKVLLDSHWDKASNSPTRHDVSSSHRCASHRRVYLKLVDNTGPEDQIAHEIFGICKDLREAWTARQDRPDHRYSNTHQSQVSQETRNKLQKVVMIYSNRVTDHEFRTHAGKCCCEVCDVLLDLKSRKFFLACHFFTFETKIEVVKKPSGNGGDGLDRNVRKSDEEVLAVETLSMGTTFDWDEAMSRLSSWK